MNVEPRTISNYTPFRFSHKCDRPLCEIDNVLERRKRLFRRNPKKFGMLASFSFQLNFKNWSWSEKCTQCMSVHSSYRATPRLTVECGRGKKLYWEKWTDFTAQMLHTAILQQKCNRLMLMNQSYSRLWKWYSIKFCSLPLVAIADW